MFRCIKERYTRGFYNNCIFCLDPSKQSICPDCINALPELGVHCPKCAEPNRHGEVCGHCLSRPPAFDFVICPYRYAGPIKRLIAKFKHKPSLVGSDVLYQILAKQLTDHQFDYIIPTPYHWQRFYFEDTILLGNWPFG